jgi:nucleotide-binding universal stress UspA family protein
MPQPERYDAVVIGSGEGGKYLAWHLAEAGQRTAVVQQSSGPPREPRRSRGHGHPRRTGVRRLLMGRVADRVIRTASCPVLVVGGRH